MLPVRQQTETNVSTGAVINNTGCINLSESVLGQRSETTGHQRIVIKECIFLSLRCNISLNLSEKGLLCILSISWKLFWQHDPSEQTGGRCRGGREWGWGGGENMTERRMSSWHRALLM